MIVFIFKRRKMLHKSTIKLTTFINVAPLPLTFTKRSLIFILSSKSDAVFLYVNNDVNRSVEENSILVEFQTSIK
jgi:hypothetical protein